MVYLFEREKHASYGTWRVGSYMFDGVIFVFARIVVFQKMKKISIKTDMKKLRCILVSENAHYCISPKYFDRPFIVTSHYIVWDDIDRWTLGPPSSDPVRLWRASSSFWRAVGSLAAGRGREQAPWAKLSKNRSSKFHWLTTAWLEIINLWTYLFIF